MKSFKMNPYSILIPLVSLSVGYMAVALYLRFVLEYEFLRVDVLGYWQDSLDWQTPFNRIHVPGYPLIIAFFRSISFGRMPPVILMMAINLAALLISAGAVYQSIIISGISQRFAVIGACLFGLWPFVGLVYTVAPLADVPAMAFLLTGLLALLCSRKWLAALLFGMSLVVHKAMWPFVMLLVFAYIYQYRPRTWKDLEALLILVLPIFVLWLTGAFYHGSPEWLISSSVSIGADTRATAPILHGIIGTIQQGGVKGTVKGGIIVAFSMASILLMFLNFKVKPSYFQYGIAICVASLFLFVYLTHLEIWAVVRFSRLLVLPLIWLIGYLYRNRLPIWLNRQFVGLLLLILFATQFAYAWYMAKVFFQ
jgi:hypothetical protein